ncbi:MAG: carbohydrate ABC transporter permease [Geminicoccaceae bacterium]
MSARAETLTMRPPQPSLIGRLFEPRELGRPAPLARVIVYALLLAWAFVVLFPMYWLAVTSLKLPIDVNQGPKYLPFVDFQPSLHAWRYLLVDIARDTFRPYLNSVIVASFSTLFALAIGSMAAYALSRITYRPKLGSVMIFLLCLAGVVVAVAVQGVDWRLAALAGVALFALLARALQRRFTRALGNGDILFWIISQRILPPVVTALPIYVMFQKLGLLDTHTALIITYATVNLPIVVWLMFDFFASVPIDLEESAQLDGASRYRIFWDIVLPLARPGLAATGLLVFVLAWNEYLLALFLSSVNAQTMPLLVAAQNATRGPQWWYMSVLIILMILPVILIALALQRFITRGLLLGAVKG